jgi:hypothetical protein
MPLKTIVNKALGKQEIIAFGRCFHRTVLLTLETAVSAVLHYQYNRSYKLLLYCLKPYYYTN